jgi:hypothetical protein
VVAIVGAIDHVVGPDGDAVRAARELAFAPRAQKSTGAVVDDDRVVGTADQVDVVVGVDGDAGDIRVFPARGQLLPAWGDFEAQARRRVCHAYGVPFSPSHGRRSTPLCSLLSVRRPNVLSQ